MQNSTTFLLDLDDTLLETWRLDGSIKNIGKIQLVSGALAFLLMFRSSTIIVTAGDVSEQMQKLEQVNIQDLFDPAQIVITMSPEEKKSAIAHLVHSRGLDPAKTYVVGDRLDCEISAGNSLLCTTIRMRLPKGKYSARESRSALEMPTHTVANFKELLSLLLLK